MDRNLFREANGIYFHIQAIEKQKQQLHDLKDQMIELLESGFCRIPEEDLYDLSEMIKKLSSHFDIDIKERWGRIDGL